MSQQTRSQLYIRFETGDIPTQQDFRNFLDSYYNILDDALPGSGVGTTGPMGPIGPTGTAGVGATGPAGSAGPAGSSGATGAAGPTGAAGSSGATGAAGPTGATGDAGLNGSIGPQGATGSAGSAGPTGATGPTGANGADGISPNLVSSYVRYTAYDDLGINVFIVTVLQDVYSASFTSSGDLLTFTDTLLVNKGLLSGDFVVIEGIGQNNGLHQISNVTSTTFTITITGYAGSLFGIISYGHGVSISYTPGSVSLMVPSGIPASTNIFIKEIDAYFQANAPAITFDFPSISHGTAIANAAISGSFRLYSGSSGTLIGGATWMWANPTVYPTQWTLGSITNGTTYKMKVLY